MRERKLISFEIPKDIRPQKGPGGFTEVTRSYLTDGSLYQEFIPDKVYHRLIVKRMRRISRSKRR